MGRRQYVKTAHHVNVSSALRAATFTVETWFRRTGTGSRTQHRHWCRDPWLGGPADREGTRRGREDPDPGHQLLPGHRLQRRTRSPRTSKSHLATAPARLNHALIGTTTIVTTTSGTTPRPRTTARPSGSTWMVCQKARSSITVTRGFAPVLDSGHGLRHRLQRSARERRRASSLGQLDEVRIWNIGAVASPDPGIDGLRDHGHGGGLLGRWGMNEGTGTTTTADSAGLRTTGPSRRLPPGVAGFPSHPELGAGDLRARRSTRRRRGRTTR